MTRPPERAGKARSMPVDRSQVEQWLREDLGHHDVTNHVPGETTGRLVAKESGVAAGLEAAVAVFDHLGIGSRRASSPVIGSSLATRF